MVKKKHFRKVIPVVLIVTLVLACPFAVFGKTQNSYKMTGKITAINHQYQTIVIEVPLGSQMFTVAGPLAPDAKLTKAGQPAKLSDFAVNETVTVIFHSTNQGHVIDRLIG
ncbi:MAG: hypothetical protein P8185_07025 [Deltaproteobacteria bacterium]|jgi:hypothetical protein